MSRALNIDAGREEVIAMCRKHGAPISTIETLPGGCTRVVLMNGDAAAVIQRQFARKIVTTPLARTPLTIVSRGIPRTSDPAPGGYMDGRGPAAERSLWPRQKGSAA